MKKTFAINERLQITGVGDFFRLLATVNPVTVEFYYQGREIAERLDVEAGFAEQFRTIQFDRVDITSATAQTVQFETALGSEIRYDRGAATISGTVALDGPTLAALEQTSTRPEANTGTWSNAAALTANTPVTVFATGVNTNGVILLAASFAERNSGANMNSCFIAKAGAAPTNTSDGDVIVGPDCINLGTSDVLLGGCLKQYQLIPSGFGLYYIASAAVAVTSNFRAARWRAL